MQSYDRLLLLDEDHFARVMLAAALRTQGYAVLAAANVAQVRPAMESYPVDVALIALTADHAGGIEAAAEIRTRRCVPTIALTNSADRRLLDLAQSYGVCALIEKPVDIKRLLPAIEHALTAAPRRP